MFLSKEIAFLSSLVCCCLTSSSCLLVGNGFKMFIDLRFFADNAERLPCVSVLSSFSSSISYVNKFKPHCLSFAFAFNQFDYVPVLAELFLFEKVGLSFAKFYSLNQFQNGHLGVRRSQHERTEPPSFVLLSNHFILVGYIS
jgi:hypothetical protein